MEFEVNPDREWLQQEYFHLQKIVEEFDARAIAIKVCGVITILVLLAVAVGTGIRALYLVTALGGILFWIVEAIWKSFQISDHNRLRQIEDFLDGVAFPDSSVQNIAHGWARGKHGVTIWRILTWPHVFMPHLAMAVIAGALYMVPHTL